MTVLVIKRRYNLISYRKALGVITGGLFASFNKYDPLPSYVEFHRLEPNVIVSK
jgi:hypothetical protein